MTTSELLGHQFLPDDNAMSEIYGLIDKNRPIDVWEMMRSYTLGVIMGKRMERARRKRNQHSWSGYGRPLPRSRAVRRSTASRIGGSQRRILRPSTHGKMP